MTRTSNDTGLQKYAPIFLKQALLWLFIVMGVIHQFLMYSGITESIYVFVEPPGYVYPFVTLQWQWWWVLLLGSLIAFVAAFSERMATIPARFTVPFYVYILFLLFLVRPISSQTQSDFVDLVITNFTVEPTNPTALDIIVVTITVKNQGNIPTESGFWTDFYISPKTLPNNPALGADHRWKNPTAGAIRGIGWKVPALGPDQSVTLRSDGSEGSIAPTVDPPNNDITDWSGTLPPGSYAFYAYADSYDGGDPTGSTHVEIVESNEQNNLSGPLNFAILSVEGSQPPASLVPPTNPPGPRPDLGQ